MPNLRRSFEKRLNQKQDVLDAMPGILGDYSGQVDAGTSGMVYVQVAQAVETALCLSVPKVAGLLVWVGYTAHQPGVLQVLGQRIGYGTSGMQTQPGVAAHAASHEWFGEGPVGGTDVVKIHLEQFMPLQVLPAGELIVAIYPGIVHVQSGWILVADTNIYGMPIPKTIDLTFDGPTTDGKARYVLISIDNMGALVKTAGTEQDVAALTLADVPEPPSNTAYVLAAVRLWYGQQTIVNNRASKDVADFRFPMVHYHLRNNLFATIAPTVDDDSGAGYSISSIWINITADLAYICVDATVGAAVWQGMGSASDPDAIHDNVSGEIAAIADKPTPVDADVTLIEDSAAANAKKKLSWANIKATLKTYFDTLYAVTAKGVTNGDTHDHNGGDGAQIDHTTLSNIGTNTHAQVDTFIASKAAASGLASLNDSSLVVQNPANATATPTASKIPIADANGLLTPWVIPGDFPLQNYQGEGDHFLQNTASYPAGWTQVDAPASTDTNQIRSFWYIQGSTGDLTWKYRKRLSFNIESTVTSGKRLNVLFGPVFFRDVDNNTDVIYRFGLYRDNAGAIDETTYIRAVLKWNDASGIWQVFGEEKDGSVEHIGTARTVSWPWYQGFYFRVQLYNYTPKTSRVFMGLSGMWPSQQMIQDQNPTTAPTYGQAWLQIEGSRAAAGVVVDYIFLGSVDAFVT